MAMRWYIVHVHSNMEKRAKANLEERIANSGLQEKFGRMLVPTEEVMEVRDGKRTVTERRIFPGYVLVEMEMSDDTWHLVKSTPRVTGFLGGSKPTPTPQKDIDKILNQVEEGAEKPRPKILFEVGETLRVKDGPFADFNGAVESVNYEKSKVSVTVTIFGRATPVELDFNQVEKV